MKKQKILKNIITPAVGVIGASSIVATTATSCSAETIDFGTIDCEWNAETQSWIASSSSTITHRSDKWNIVVTTAGNRSFTPFGNWSVRKNVNLTALIADRFNGNVQANNEHIYLNYTSDRYANAELLVQSGQLKEESGSGYAQLDFQLLGVDQTSLPTESL